ASLPFWISRLGPSVFSTGFALFGDTGCCYSQQPIRSRGRAVAPGLFCLQTRVGSKRLKDLGRRGSVWPPARACSCVAAI
ncbi:hypothetical protein LEMLEM_LOCUS19926, partial [Lemmus lemmus]